MTRTSGYAIDMKSPKSVTESVTPEEFGLLEKLLIRWRTNPVYFVTEGLGATPDPWQCDVLDSIYQDELIAVRACHGVGKTALMAWATIHFLTMFPFSETITTAPTYIKQVKDVMWKEIARWWRDLDKRARWLTQDYDFTTTRLQHRSPSDAPKKYVDWFALGVASNPPINMEGFHAPHILVEIDEAKGVAKPTWDSIHGMRMTQDAKLLVASTPGGPAGEFFKVWTKYRSTWKTVFSIHPEALKPILKRPEAKGVYPLGHSKAGQQSVGVYAKGGTYYSKRISPERIEERAKEWGVDSPVYIARVIGDFPTIEDDVLIPYSFISDAVDREEGIDGPIWVGCDVARFGSDRTVAYVMRGGTALHGESIARSAAESTAPEVEEFGVGDEPKRPRYRSEVATANMLYRLVTTYGAAGACVDDTGLGGGAVTLLKEMGIKTIPISFGVPPTDRPRTPELMKLKKSRNQPDSLFTNLKMQMAWALRAGFESGGVALAHLDEVVRDPLVAQLSLVKTKLTDIGKLKLVDPDEDESEDDWATLLGDKERKRSPDHFHALLLAWWMSGTAAAFLEPKAKAILPDAIRTVGRLRRQAPSQKDALPNPVASTMRGVIVGPGRYLGGMYRAR